MAIACVEALHARVSLQSERLTVSASNFEGGEPAHLGDIPLAELETLVVNSNVQVTSQAISELLRRSIPLHFVDACGRSLGTCLPFASPQAATRLRQYRRAQEPEFSLEVARR